MISSMSSSKAYPRRHGGNQAMAGTEKRIKGLSPQARGKHYSVRTDPQRAGPIPAGTGETGSLVLNQDPNRAYPRRHGGNLTGLQKDFRPTGLSPQARGKQVAAAQVAAAQGPIPAGTGETLWGLSARL